MRTIENIERLPDVVRLLSEKPKVARTAQYILDRYDGSLTTLDVSIAASDNGAYTSHRYLDEVRQLIITSCDSLGVQPPAFESGPKKRIIASETGRALMYMLLYPGSSERFALDAVLTERYVLGVDDIEEPLVVGADACNAALDYLYEKHKCGRGKIPEAQIGVFSTLQGDAHGVNTVILKPSSNIDDVVAMQQKEEAPDPIDYGFTIPVAALSERILEYIDFRIDNLSEEDWEALEAVDADSVASLSDFVVDLHLSGQHDMGRAKLAMVADSLGFKLPKKDAPEVNWAGGRRAKRRK